ncbi:hypothetical protein LJB78_01085, partial [Bacteroidales bacterium OttesenSCG-928-J16]|nr:hypothetical protein [Bacteroidales bacterium OttesenSCG-928-J16]
LDSLPNNNAENIVRRKYRIMTDNTATNKRFAVMRDVCPQKILSDFQAFTPARTYSNLALRQAAKTLYATQTGHRKTG